MRVLLDECIPRKLKTAFAGYDCQTVPEAGLAGQKNGCLLSLAEAAGFALFVTMDKGLQYQQNLAGRRIAILIVRAKTNRFKQPVVKVPKTGKRPMPAHWNQEVTGVIMSPSDFNHGLLGICCRTWKRADPSWV